MQLKSRIILIAVQFLLLPAVDSAALQQRSSYDIPLVNLSVTRDENGVVREVKIRAERSGDELVITPKDDYAVEKNRHGRKRFIHPEGWEKAYLLTVFEASALDEVVQSLIRTLRGFEDDLRRERWDRLLYLDSYFPRFLKGFNSLVRAARNSSEALPAATRIPDSLYDVSLHSPRSDARIGYWQAHEEHRVKLRIITRELAHQAKLWRKRELDNARRDPEMKYSEKFEAALGLFIRMYFNMFPLPLDSIPSRGGHL